MARYLFVYFVWFVGCLFGFGLIVDLAQAHFVSLIYACVHPPNLRCTAIGIMGQAVRDTHLHSTQTEPK